MKTVDDLVNRAIGILNEDGAGQPVADEDAELVKGYADDLLPQLLASGIVTLYPGQQIAEEIFTPLARMLANEAGPEFGRPRDQGIFDNSELQIRRVLANSVVPDRRRQEYF
jgi:hypothetical protein